MARYSTGRRIETCRQCAEIQTAEASTVAGSRSRVWVCGLRDVSVRPDQRIPQRCTLPVAPEKEPES